MKNNGNLSRSVARASKLLPGPARPDSEAASLADLAVGLAPVLPEPLYRRMAERVRPSHVVATFPGGRQMTSMPGFPIARSKLTPPGARLWKYLDS
jgi:hypothetical protein